MKGRILFDSGDVLLTGYNFPNATVAITHVNVSQIQQTWNESTCRFLSIGPCDSCKPEKMCLQIKKRGFKYPWELYPHRYFMKYMYRIKLPIKLHENPILYGNRAWQTLNFHAHTIQLFFKGVVERKKQNQVNVIDYLLQQQTQIPYLKIEYALRDVYRFL